MTYKKSIIIVWLLALTAFCFCDARTLGLISPEDSISVKSITGIVLEWQPVCCSYELFFGTDYPPTNIENGLDLTQSYYDTGLLKKNETYYWQIKGYGNIANVNDTLSIIRTFNTFNQLYINEILASNSNTNMDSRYKNFSDWIEIFNSDSSYVGIGNYHITDDLNDPFKWSIPSYYHLLPGGYKVFWADNKDYQNHTNFKINAESEFIGLFTEDGNLVDSITINNQVSDISYGRNIDNTDEWSYYCKPTPEDPNSTMAYDSLNFCQPPSFSQKGGFALKTNQIELFTESLDDLIYYTKDGTVPDTSSFLYSGGISLDSAMVIRARCFNDSLLPSSIITQTFFPNQKTTLPLISIVTDPYYFWDYNYGYYVKGIHYNGTKWSGNYFQDWERPVNIEMYDIDGEEIINQRCGTKMYGAGSRIYPQKSIAIFAREKYGKDKFDYKFFEDKDIDSFDNLVLRNSGNDIRWTMFRDGFIQNLIKDDINIDYQEFTPAILFINGVYWGIHNIREKINESYLVGNYKIDEDDIDLLARERTIVHGNSDNYDALLSFLESSDLSIPENYDYVKTQIDIDNFIDYQIIEIFIGNADWPGNNIKFWRHRIPDGKWRWILYDTDWGYGSINSCSYDNMQFATEAEGPDWPNPPWSTFLLRKLFESDEFSLSFIQRFSSYLNTTFSSDRALRLIDNFKNIINDEIDDHINRWKDEISIVANQTYRGLESLYDWNNNIEILKSFAIGRPANMREDLREYFDLDGLVRVTISVENPNEGDIELNEVTIVDSELTGFYFCNVPIKLKAIPKPGFMLHHWEGIPETSEHLINFSPNIPCTVMAKFKPIENVVINEINYNSAENFDPDDWVELFNYNTEPIDISGWILKDSDDSHLFIFPDNTIIESYDYLVVCKNETQFLSVFPQRLNTIGNFGFGLSGNSDQVRLFNRNNSLMDFVEYDDNIPWPLEPDGNGATLELINYSLDNELPENWAESLDNGTPGEVNSKFEEITRKNVTHFNQNKLSQSYPNPFIIGNSLRSATEINYSIHGVNRDDNKSNVKISIYNLKGQKVKNLINKNQYEGEYSVFWNGKDSNSKSVPSGIYFYNLLVDNKLISVRKLVIIR